MLKLQRIELIEIPQNSLYDVKLENVAVVHHEKGVDKYKVKNLLVEPEGLLQHIHGRGQPHEN